MELPRPTSGLFGPFGSRRSRTGDKVLLFDLFNFNTVLFLRMYEISGEML